MAVHFSTLTVSEIRRETPECVSVVFEVPEALKADFKFIEGQSLTLRKTINGQDIRRSYSICSAPADNELRVAIKEIKDGAFSSYVNKHLKVGDQIDVMPPTGSFYSPVTPSSKQNFTAFAAGSGITPVMSIIKSTLQKSSDSTFTLIYGNKNRASIIFKEEIDALKNRYMDRFRVYHLLSRETTDTPLNNGRINAEKCQLLFRSVVDVQKNEAFYLCGPAEMIFCVRDELKYAGIPESKIHFELFTTPAPSLQREETTVVKAPKSGEQVASVTIKIDGNTMDFDLPFNGDAILDAGMQLGADLPYACKGGVCAACRAKLLEGEVEMDENYALEKDELKAGFILTCQSHPRSERVVVDYDQQ